LVSGPEGVCEAGGVLIVVAYWMMLLKSIDFFESRLSEAIPSQMLRFPFLNEFTRIFPFFVGQSNNKRLISLHYRCIDR
jgi:hypothetical protein